MKNLFLIIMLLLTVQLSHGMPPKAPSEYGLRHYQLSDNVHGKINFYVTKNGIETKKPLLLLLDGSGHLPLYSFIKKPDGTSEIFGSVPFRYNTLSDKFHVVLISKPGTPFLDSLNVGSYREFKQQYPPSEEYSQKLSLEWRLNTASSVIDFLVDELNIDANSITVIGYSEGGQVVSKLAVENPKITKIVSIVGGGLNQFNDFITAERLKAQRGIISADSAQVNIDRLMAQFQEIYENPSATDKFWLGHTYLRWSSFCNNIPLENMLNLDIPILLVSGGNDKNSPITGIDYVPLEFLRQKKNNLTYEVYPNCDHWFNDQVNKKNLLHEMMDDVIEWVIEDQE